MRLAGRLPRFIFVSPGCAAKHGPMLTRMKASALGARGSRWRWFGPAQKEADIFLARAAKRSGQSRDSEMVTLVVPEEMGAADMAGFPRKTTLRNFVTGQIWQIDQAQSLTGVCGR